MNTENPIQMIKEALKPVLQTKKIDWIESKTRFKDDLDFDSGMFIELLMTLEELFPEYQIDPVELHQSDFESVGTLAKCISNLKIDNKNSLEEVTAQ